MEGEWSCYISGQFNGGRMVILREVCQFNGGRMVMLRRWASLMEGAWSCYRGGQFNGGRMVMEVASLLEENGHVTEVASLMEEELSCYKVAIEDKNSHVTV